MDERAGQIAVIFVSQRTGEDAAGYAAAAAAMDALAAEQPGFCGMNSVAAASGAGITVSFWSDEVAALAWRDNPEHRATREAGRVRWYSQYEVIVCAAARSYRWAADT